MFGGKKTKLRGKNINNDISFFVWMEKMKIRKVDF